MITIDLINMVIKIFFMNLCTCFTFLKIINYKNINITKIIMTIITSIIISIIYNILRVRINWIVTILFSYFLYSVFLSIITKNKIDYSIIITFISLSISFLGFIVSASVAFFVIKLLRINISSNNPITLLFIVSVEVLLTYYFFKIKRFKNGFSFLKNKNKTGNIGIFAIIVSGTIIFTYGLLDNNYDKFIGTYLFVGFIIVGIGMIIWIRKKITLHYKQKVKEKTIEELETEIKEKDKTIEKISAENSNLATIIHKYNDRFSALELSVKNFINTPSSTQNNKTELGAEYSDILDQINTMSKEYSNEVMQKTKHKKKLPPTNIFGIDNIFEYMLIESIKNNINFNLKINGSINYMISNIIPKNKLETLISDHIKDAIIAINSSTNTHRSIMAMLGIMDNCYEFCVYDTGIEFEINTLLNLGLKAITTHSDTGGSGIGFMTTFETLKECKASLIIEEKQPSNTDYTKAVIIRFDGKEEYKIRTYRANEINLCNKDNRIIIENL